MCNSLKDFNDQPQIFLNLVVVFKLFGYDLNGIKSYMCNGNLMITVGDPANGSDLDIL